MDVASVKQLQGELGVKNIDELFLDAENPRLPEELRGATQERLLKYLFDTAVLEELARSFANNGFFAHEPLIIVKVKNKKDHYTVVEGNRRLAALIILHHRPEANDLRFDVEIDEAQLDSLREIPCFEVESLKEVHKFLGFRHIGGIKKWSPEAKARYIAHEIENFHKESPNANPFREVAKRVGSNTQSVRNNYIAITILRYARDDFDLDVRSLQNERFGVWQRALNSPDIREYVGFQDALEYDEIHAALKKLKIDNLKRVLSDLTAAGAEKALVADSRNLTDYGRILQNKRASAMLARYRDFDTAKRLIDEIDLPKRIRAVRRDCEIILDDLKQVADGSEDLKAAATELYGVTRAILGSAKQLIDNE
jgi:hypothetical protein